MHRTLIDTQTLARHVVPRTASGWRVVDCRAVLQSPDEARAAYAAGHLPGAVFADLEADLSGPVVPGRTGRHPLPDRGALAARLSAWGIGNDTQIVAYDAGPGMFAARLWWLVRWLGHDAVAVLDGGLAAWQRAGMPVSTDTPAFEPEEFAVREPLTHVVSTREVGAALPDMELLDARDEARFRAEQEPIDPVAGHIPGAYCVPFQGNLRDDGCFRAADELRTRFAPHVASGRPVVCYCGSGVTAAHNVLAMVHGGLPEPALYAGSWSEWILDPARPVER